MKLITYDQANRISDLLKELEVTYVWMFHTDEDFDQPYITIQLRNDDTLELPIEIVNRAVAEHCSRIHNELLELGVAGPLSAAVYERLGLVKKPSW